jgi:O-antigen ligase
MFVRIRRMFLFLSGLSLTQYLQTFSIGPVVSTPNKAVTAILLVLAVLQLVVAPRPFPRNAKNYWVLAFAGSTLIAMVVTVTTGVSPLNLVRPGSQYAAVILFYFVLVYVVSERRDLNVLLWGLTLGTVITSVSGFLGLGEVEQFSTYERTGGLGGNPNLLGYAAAAVLPIAFALFAEERKNWRRGLLLACILLILAGIVSTLSRSAYVSVAAIAVFLVWRFRRLDLLRYAPLLLLLVGGVVVVAPESFFARVETMTSEEARTEDLSIQGRLFDYATATRAFASNPISGVGFYRFGVWANENVHWRVHGKKAIHNAYLWVAADQGLMGLVPFLAILVLSWRDFSRVQQMARRGGRHGDPQLVQLGRRALFLQASLLACLVGNFFSPAVQYKSPWLIYALSTVLIEFVRQETKAPSETASPAEQKAPLLGAWVHPRQALRDRS